MHLFVLFSVLELFLGSYALPASRIHTTTPPPTTTTTTQASPMGENSCPFLPCPYVSPHACVGPLETNNYWTTNQLGQDIFCEGCYSCDTGLAGKRELNAHEDCEAILCAPLGPNCKVSATREPTLLVDHNGHPCPACPVCLDYITYPPTVA